MTAFETYQDWTDTTALYPGAGEGADASLVYVALGLTGEAGEVANKVKKILRDGDEDEHLREQVLHELGDVLWYVTRAAVELGVDLSFVAWLNQQKLNRRAKRGTIQGSGDDR